MSETTMPAAEAAVATNDELSSYELAFHILPTVAEGEVSTIEDAIKSIITKAGGTVGLTESAQRFDLAYELQKLIDGKYRRFTTSHFGWMRFTAEPGVVEGIFEEVEAHEAVLRALLVRLTRQEEAHPFYLHESLTARKPVTNIELDETDTDTDVSEEDTATVDDDADVATSSDDTPEADKA